MRPTMVDHNHDNLVSAVFLTFSGNCKEALNFYQTCFGGELQLETFDKEINGYSEKPVVSGLLVSDSITIYGSDLVPDEGRKLGNYISIFIQCKNTAHRTVLLEKMQSDKNAYSADRMMEQPLIEITDAYGVRWMLGC